ncbi:hypothetical protein D4760_11700 [Eubacterium callanderi]|nr:hypothetical protein [Eubacterium callanderi]
MSVEKSRIAALWRLFNSVTYKIYAPSLKSRHALHFDLFLRTNRRLAESIKNTAHFDWNLQTVKEVARPETAPFIQIRKKVQALRITTRNRAKIPEQPDTGEIKVPL